MTCLIDKINTLSKQSVSAAAIIDSNGNLAGKVLVRFTHSYIGWNHEVVAFLFNHDNMRANDSLKGGTYDTPATLYKIFHAAGLECLDWHKRTIGGYSNKQEINVDSLSGFNDIRYIKQGNKLFTLNWVI